MKPRVNLLFWAGFIIFLTAYTVAYIHNQRPEVVERHRRERIERDLERDRQIELSEKRRAASACAEFAGTSEFDGCFQGELEHVKTMDDLDRMRDENPPNEE
jgi:hypothetical protein